ncbi:hypothetical protein DB31_6119 [Hyalangium minutum]|uniref:Uncharacterized protein n=1 Tax=Hyalangium minutum TaxID=394096 RepID=A0A085VVR4_9BACT|nr:hypothetical protein DB31_6119 [Hyalangium minutum]
MGDCSFEIQGHGRAYITFNEPAAPNYAPSLDESNLPGADPRPQGTLL